MHVPPRVSTVRSALVGVGLVAGCNASSRCDVDTPCLLVDGLAAGLLSVRAPADDDVWIVGASPDPDDGSGPVALHFDGTTWSRLGTSVVAGAELWWVHVDADEAVMVGNRGTILELDRASEALAAIDGPAEEVTFFGVWGATSDDLWAVGQTSGGPPAVWRRTAGTWAPFSDPVFDALGDGVAVFKVHGTGPDDVWFVGDQGFTARWDGTSVTRIDSGHPTSPLLTVDAGGPRPVAVGGIGNGLVLEYDGAAWVDVSPRFQPGFNGVCAGADATVAVGQNGLHAVRDGAGTWVSDAEAGTTPLTSYDWHGCAVSPGGDLWMVGGRIASRPLNAGLVGHGGPTTPPTPSL